MDVSPISATIKHSTVSLLRRVALASSPYRDLVCHLLARFWAYGESGLVPGTIVSRIHNFGMSPLSVFLGTGDQPHLQCSNADGVVDSLKYLMFHENFNKPWSF